MQHKTKWTWVSENGGVLYFNTEEAARSHALTYGGRGIRRPIYA